MLDPRPANTMPLTSLIAGLRAAGEDTRLRILALLDAGELTVTDLTDILGQSQPRVSRHLKLMAEAGLIERSREGAWAFFRLADRTGLGQLARALIERIDPHDATIASDRDRLQDVRAQRAEVAQAYFSRHAAEWDRIRSLHAAEAVVESKIKALIGDAPLASLLDLGTGTGRMVSLLGAQAQRIVGVDASHAMLAVARANLESDGIKGVEWRQGDLYALPVERNAFELVIIHQVLHFLDDPSRAIREAAQALAPGGRLMVIDFAPHDLEFLRETQAHRRLGFSVGQMSDWLIEAGLEIVHHDDIAPPYTTGGELTVSIFVARDLRKQMALKGGL
jgi:ubiquinone/menaquinone biosynthesis C-methylase UbiE